MQFPLLKTSPITLYKRFFNGMIVTIASLTIYNRRKIYRKYNSCLVPLLFVSFYSNEKRRRVNSFSIAWFH